MPGGRLAGWSGIAWLLGTHGLDGSEQLYLVGNADARGVRTRDAIAALLYLMGQAEIVVVDEPASELLAAIDPVPGATGGVTRESVYTATMRSTQIVLTSELAAALKQSPAPTLLDGRSEAAYRGMLSRGPRGGHIPGAMHWQPSLASALDPAGSAIVYGEDSLASLALAGQLLMRMPALRVYIDGWVAWSTDTRLPVDALSYPRVRAASAASASTQATVAGTGSHRQFSSAVLTALVLAAVLGFFGGRLGALSRRSGA